MVKILESTVFNRVAFAILLGVAAEKTLNCLLKGRGNEMSMEHGRKERRT